MSGPIVSVTGASGFLAGQVIKLLLERGYRVRGSVRSLSDESKVKYLTDLFPSLQLFEADLLKEGSFDSMIEGCEYVVHTASPFITVVDDPENDLIKPAVEGTLNVLRSVLKSGTVKRVALTSSVAAVAGESDIGRPLTEDDWNMDSTPSLNPYRYSKRVAEQEAIKFAKENPKFELVSLNPSFILGPPLSTRTDATSIKTIKIMMEGGLKTSGARPLCFGIVDIRDVALAHVLALEVKEAAGHRFLLTSPEGVSQLEIAQILKEEFPDWPLPEHAEGPFNYRVRMDISKAKDLLKLEFTPFKKAILDMAHKMIELGMIQKPD